jgi:outer membrane protein OmpA-like peptidoglycan-associated protein
MRNLMETAGSVAKRAVLSACLGVLAVSLAGAADQPTSDEIADKLSKDSAMPRSRSLELDKVGDRGIVNAAEAAEEPAAIDLVVNFEFNSADLTSDGTVLVGNLGRALKDARLAGQRFLIEGHTDAVGSDGFNQGLSLRRAGRVRQELISRFGVKPARIEVQGFGESRLLDPDHPEADVNRRVRVVNLGEKGAKK